MGSYDNWASLFLIHPRRILESQCGKRDSHLSLAYFTNLKNSKRYPPRTYAVAEMGVTKEQVESTLNSKLSPSHLDVIDTSGGCGASFTVEIVSEQFEGKRLLERHRMVNAALAEEMNQIHALSITKAVTPEQWKQQLESQKSEAAA